MAIDVFCDGHLDADRQPTHQRWIVLRWIRIEGEWSSTSRYSDDGEPLRLLRDQDQVQLIYNDMPIVGMENWRTDARTRFRCECTRCGMTVVFNGTEELGRILDTLEAHDVPSLSLRALAATLA